MRNQPAIIAAAAMILVVVTASATYLFNELGHVREDIAELKEAEQFQAELAALTSVGQRAPALQPPAVEPHVDEDTHAEEGADAGGEAVGPPPGPVQYIASGGGVNVKMMPDPETHEATVAMPEVFSFDMHHAMCRVETNPEAFMMPTFEMGDVVVEEHSMFMSMLATTIESSHVTVMPDGHLQVRMEGEVAVWTAVGHGPDTVGSRTEPEMATYIIEAVDGGMGGGAAGDSFAFTVFFDPEHAPVNYAMFGPEFTFTGEMTEGEITIEQPVAH